MKPRVCASLLTLLVVGAGARTIAAQTLCYPITPGDTAARIAERLTGDPQNRHAPWFQIVDQRWTLVSKFDYDVIHPGWHACLAEARLAAIQGGGHSSSQGRLAVGQRQQSALPLQESVDFSFVLVATFLLGAVLVLRYGTRSAKRLRARARVLRRFGVQFVQEFGRPMTQFRGAIPAPRARLRIRPRRLRVEILLAPTDGGGYPNLADHRSNVEYDVARVMAAVGRDTFVNDRPYAEGQWVVLPFHFRGPDKREGVR